MDILNQDRDLIVTLVKGQLNFGMKIANDIFYGYNIWHGSALLGTYDTPEEVYEQIKNIRHCGEDLYRMGGFCNYEINFKELEDNY